LGILFSSILCTCPNQRLLHVSKKLLLTATHLNWDGLQLNTKVMSLYVFVSLQVYRLSASD
jgi:hypothetical protein